ncbi:hypothetical protein ACHAWF_007607 [Thalassiosira exigua]
MFVDYYFNEYDQYLATLEMEAIAALQGPDGQWYAHLGSEFEAAVQYRESWAHIFEATQESEDWTPIQLQEVAYVCDASNVDGSVCQDEVEEPQVVMTIDAKGKTVPRSHGCQGHPRESVLALVARTL